MEPIEFWKMSGTGNDFIIIDNRKEAVKEQDMSRLVARSCRRRESVGADGVIFVTDSKIMILDGGFLTPTAGRWKCAVTVDDASPVSPF
jgi:diaminopimelate epimerase